MSVEQPAKIIAVAASQRPSARRPGAPSAASPATGLCQSSLCRGTTSKSPSQRYLVVRGSIDDRAVLLTQQAQQAGIFGQRFSCH